MDLDAPRWKERGTGDLRVGNEGLAHAAAAKGMAKDFSGSLPWITEVWWVPYKWDNACSELRAGGRGVGPCQGPRLRDAERPFLIRMPYAVRPNK